MSPLKSCSHSRQLSYHTSVYKYVVSMLTYDRKDNNASEHRCEAIGEGHHDGISITVVVNGVIRRESNKATKSKSQ
jgi:hypothetical protein